MFQIICSARHDRCGQAVRLSDYRIHSLEELREQYKAGYKPLEFWCDPCMEKLQPTHAEVFAVEELKFRYVLEKSTIEEFVARTHCIS